MFGKKHPEAQKAEQAAPVATPAVVPSNGKLTPSATVSVSGRPTFAGVLNFQREFKGTIFKFKVTEATVKNYRSVHGYTISGERKDGPLKTLIAHDFGTRDTKVKLTTSKDVSGRKLTTDYTLFTSKPSEGLVDASIELDKSNKFAGSYNLGNQLAALSYTAKREDMTYTASVNSRQAVKMQVSQKRGPDTFTASYIFPVVVGAEWKRDNLKVVAQAPITQDGLGDMKLTATVEKTIQI